LWPGATGEQWQATQAQGLVGLAARPNLIGRTPQAAPMQSVTTGAAGHMDIEVRPPVAAPIPRSTGKLEVLPPDLANGALPLVVASAARVAPPPTLEQQAEPPASRCARAGSLGAQVVCEDPALTRADRRMTEAYRRALRAGAPAADLREEQEDWLAIREDAARHSPDAVANIYRQRIDELEALAEEGPG